MDKHLQSANEYSVVGYGKTDNQLTGGEIEAILAADLDRLKLDDQRVLVIIPDHTRSMPLPLFFRLLTRHLSGIAAALDFMVALGTHPPLSQPELLRLVGLTLDEKEARYSHIQLINHTWKDPQALLELGTIPASEISEISGGKLTQDVPVRINRRIMDYDQLLICGPVFPHEVAGFSGGNKYFFPGISGPQVIDISHWLGALITSYTMIGTKDTPVRRVIDRAASLIPRSRHALCAVVTHEGLNGLYCGAPEAAQSAAADLSAQMHIRRVAKPFQQALSVLPEMYDEIWTGAKGMYKLEPIIADGGEVILYAPHIKEFSVVHGDVIRRIGYHVRDYFTKQWDKFSHLPWGVLAHSTHLRGVGAFENGVERPRIQVTLATGIPEDICRAANLGYRDPNSIDPQEWAGREDQGILLVPRAGEYLYRLAE